jgi:acyl carrier protein
MSSGSIDMVATTGVSEIVNAMLARKGLPAAGPTDNLRDAGLSSLDMVNLMMAVEDALDIELPQAAMTYDNFRCIQAIEATVAAL